MIQTLLTSEKTSELCLWSLRSSNEENDCEINRQKSETSTTDNDTTTTASIQSLLLDLQPLIHLMAHFLRIIQWKNVNPKYSLTLILLWIVVRSMHDFILYLMPIILLSVISTLRHVYPSSSTILYGQQSSADEDLDKKETLKEDLNEIWNTLHYILSIRDTIQNSDTLCNLHHRQFSMASAKQRSTIYLGAACLFILFYIEWVILIRQQIINNCASVLWFLTLMVMCSCSPWLKLVLSAITCKVLPIIYFFTLPHDTHGITIVTNSDTTTSVPTAVDTQSEPSGYDDTVLTTKSGYCFEIYHHQRWWFPYGWSDLLLPQDRPVWSDIHLESTPSIYDFKLPPTTTYTDESSGLFRQKIISWTWIDPSWMKQHPNDGSTNNCDEDGWQYGSWKWKSWSLQSSGFGVHTRRQKWVRYAQRKETLIWPKHSFLEEKINYKSSSYCNSLIGGSDTTTISSAYSSIYNWDNETSAPSSIHSSNIITATSPSLSSSVTFKPPTLILDVLKPTSLRSSRSAIFNTPILSCNKNNLPSVSIVKITEKNEMIHGHCYLPNSSKKPKRHSI